MKDVLLRSLSVLALGVIALTFTGCACFEQETAVAAAPPPPAPVVQSAGCPAVIQEGGNITVRMAIPTGDPKTSVVLLEKTAPAEVYVGKTMSYTIKATNLTDCPLDDVTVLDKLPAGFTMEGSAPQATLGTDGVASWNLGTIDAGASKEIVVKGAPKTAGEHKNCVQVTYKRNLCLTIKAVEPGLKLAKSLPRDVLLCDAIPVKLTVTNPGSGVTKNVRVTDALPEGLVTADNQKQVAFGPFDIAPGETKTFDFIAKAQKTGTFTNVAAAKADADLESSAEATVTVRQPVLTIAKKGTAREYAGRNVTYDITVANTGDATATDVVLVDTLPTGTSFVSATGGGMAEGQKVVWKLGNLAPEATKTVSVTAKTATIGTITNTAVVGAKCAGEAKASVSTTIAGVPAVLLEVIDVVDPLEVGEEETYVITATNQGSIPAQQVAIRCEIEENQSYVSSDGPTSGSHANGIVTFQPLASLGVGEKATWKVVVKGVKPGDVRFHVSMNVQFLKRPVDETEATQIY